MKKKLKLWLIAFFCFLKIEKCLITNIELNIFDFKKLNQKYKNSIRQKESGNSWKIFQKKSYYLSILSPFGMLMPAINP